MRASDGLQWGPAYSVAVMGCNGGQQIAMENVWFQVISMASSSQACQAVMVGCKDYGFILQ